MSQRFYINVAENDCGEWYSAAYRVRPYSDPDYLISELGPCASRDEAVEEAQAALLVDGCPRQPDDRVFDE